ncbi:MAG: glycosyltransferase [Verrucomicrobiota bacterium]|jgi:glycosyltransferase involved in cell wall biosynthesis
MSAKATVAIVSPVKNEAPNLPALLRAVESQTHPLSLWVIVDDQSTDGGCDFLREHAGQIRNVEHVVVVRTEGLAGDYALGAKYAGVIARGFRAVREQEAALGIKYDYIGILDADCFVAADYYERLLEKFVALPKLGIASGYLEYVNGELRTRPRFSRRWPRGGIRLWRAECLDEAGYFMVKSADAVSCASAWLKGWQSQAFPDATGETRSVGVRSDPLYYGRAAYFNFVPIYHILLKCALDAATGEVALARNSLRGYMQARQQGERAAIPAKVQWYFRLLPFHSARESAIVLMNHLKLKLRRGR